MWFFIYNIHLYYDNKNCVFSTNTSTHTQYVLYKNINKNLSCFEMKFIFSLSNPNNEHILYNNVNLGTENKIVN